MSFLLAVRKGEDVMSTMKGNLRRTILTGVVGTVLAVGMVGTARAEFGSDRAAAILIYPKVVVDTSGTFGQPTNTEIQLTNTSNSVTAVRCFLVNATSHCSNDPTKACTVESEAPGSNNRQCDSTARCVPQWTESDFQMTLTKRQPVSWNALDGLDAFPLDPTRNPLGKSGQGGQSNIGSFVRPVPEDPFFGALTCVEVDPATFLPISGFNPANNGGGDLKGEATIVSEDKDMDFVDARKYNAVGLQSSVADGGSGPNSDNSLVVGGPNPEYTGCPNVLILDNMFDGAEVKTHTVGGSSTSSATVTTDLTVVPCSQDFSLGAPSTALLQMLVFNEFEQRFSTSTRVTCFREVPLSDIDTPPGSAGDSASIFNVAVEGTLSGQTRIRSVENTTTANGVVGIAESFWKDKSGSIIRFHPSSTAANLHFTGTHTNPDIISLPGDIAGVCVGGNNDGQPCATSDQCGGGTCM
jgi:hypothetical protein